VGVTADAQRIAQIRARIADIREELNALLRELGDMDETAERRRFTVVKG
jgi:hypothetical protein